MNPLVLFPIRINSTPCKAQRGYRHPPRHQTYSVAPPPPTRWARVSHAQTAQRFDKRREFQAIKSSVKIATMFLDTHLTVSHTQSLHTSLSHTPAHANSSCCSKILLQQTYTHTHALSKMYICVHVCVCVTQVFVSPSASS